MTAYSDSIRSEFPRVTKRNFPMPVTLLTGGAHPRSSAVAAIDGRINLNPQELGACLGLRSKRNAKSW